MVLTQRSMVPPISATDDPVPSTGSPQQAQSSHFSSFICFFRTNLFCHLTSLLTPTPSLPSAQLYITYISETSGHDKQDADVMFTEWIVHCGKCVYCRRGNESHKRGTENHININIATHWSNTGIRYQMTDHLGGFSLTRVEAWESDRCATSNQEGPSASYLRKTS